MAKEFGKGFVTGAGKRDKKRGRAPKQITSVQQPQQQFDPYAPDTINLYQTGPSAPIATAQPMTTAQSMTTAQPTAKAPLSRPTAGTGKEVDYGRKDFKPRDPLTRRPPRLKGIRLPLIPPPVGGEILPDDPPGDEPPPYVPPPPPPPYLGGQLPDLDDDEDYEDIFILPDEIVEEHGPIHELPGCTVSHAENFQPVATYDDGSCDFERPGCIDPAARNYSGDWSVTWEGDNNYIRLGANVDDGSCLFSTYTCTDSQALNWNSACPPSDQFIGDGMWITEYSQFRLSIPGPGNPNASEDLIALPVTIQNKLDLNDPVVFTPTSGPIEGRIPYLITSLAQVSVDDMGTNYMAQVEAVTTSESSY